MTERSRRRAGPSRVLAASSQRFESGWRAWRRVGGIAVGAGLVCGGLTGLRQALGWNGWIVGAAIFAATVVMTLTLRRGAAPDASSEAAATTSRS